MDIFGRPSLNEPHLMTPLSILEPVLDRFHIASSMNKALVDEVRAKEAKALAQQGYEPVLKHSRWCLLKRPENLTDKQDVKLADLVR